MKRLLAAVLATTAAVLLAGCGVLPAPDVTATPDTSGVSRALRPFYGQSIVWKDCGGGFRCATARAPVDWAQPGGERLRLALTMKPATGTRIGILFTNPGGPGASGVDFLKSAAEDIFDRYLRDHYDLVAWDPRGVGASSPVDCYGTRDLDAFLFDDPDLPEGSAALRSEVVDGAKDFGQACLERTGDRLAHVGTADTVQDLDMLRAAVGAARLDYFGFSYGTAIGAQYADRFPRRVGRMVLDGAVDPANSAFEESLANTRAFGAALTSYLADCLRSSDCPFRGQTVDQALDTIASLLLAVRDSPIRAADGRAVNSAVVRTAINAALYDRGSWTYLTQAFARILRGDPSVAQALADSYVERGKNGYTDNLFEAIYAVDCLDKPVSTDRAELERQGRAIDAADPLRRANNTEELGDPVCGQWPIPPQGRPGRVTAVGAPPIVVLGTTGDPATPLEWGRSLAGQLPGGVLLTLRGEGHTAYRDDVRCINDRVDRFLVQGTVPTATTCG